MPTAPLKLIAVLFGLGLMLPVLGADAKPLRQTIDEQLVAAWKQEKVTPAGLADDATFLRRIYLDLCGIIPTYEETKSFLEDQEPNKRAKLIDRLLDDPRYALHQADVWDLLFFTRNPPGFETDKRPGFQKWLREQFAKNTPYDQWARSILKGEGNSLDDGPSMYLVQFDRQPEDATEKITQTFLGVQLQCARCHNHPFDEWTQKDFYGMAAFLARLATVQVGSQGALKKMAIGEKNSGDILFTGPAKDAVPGKKGEPIKPKFLHGAELEEPVSTGNPKDEKFAPNKMPPAPTFSRKDKLAEWITAQDNPYFAKAVVNRIWAQYMGRGIIHPVDNLTQSQRASHPELLDALTKQFVEQKFDLKWLIREVCNSKAYQLAGSGPVEDAMPKWFERARVRPLSAEELVESWRVATGFETKASGKDGDKKERFQGVTWDYMVRYFGQPNDGVGNFQGGLQEHMYLNNGEVGRLIGTEKGSLLDTLSKSSDPWDARVERLYLSVLNRKPKPEESKKFVAFLSEGKDDQAGRVRDAIWTLMTCSEFRFNH